MWKRRILPAVAAIVIAGGLWWMDVNEPTASTVSPKFDRPAVGVPATAIPADGDLDPTDSVDNAELNDLLDRSAAAVAAMQTSLDDYTATFIKQERDDDGVLSPLSRIDLKVQTRLRNDAKNAPKRVYLRFVAPENVAGREVLWGEDLYDGQMAVHETAFLLNLKTIWLDPTGMIAMQGQRYPISEIGLVRLAEKLIQRGESLRRQPGVTVSSESALWDGHRVTTFTVTRPVPTGGEDDFAIARVTLDFERNLVLGFESYGWSDEPDSDPPLIESYAYRNVQTNVGLTDDDFDVKNQTYNFP